MSFTSSARSSSVRDSSYGALSDSRRAAPIASRQGVLGALEHQNIKHTLGSPRIKPYRDICQPRSPKPLRIS